MRFAVYLDPKGTTWPPPTHVSGTPIILDVDPDARLEDVASEAIRIGGEEMHGHYFFADSGPHYWAAGLRDASSDGPELVPFPRVVVDATGEFLWTEGGRSRMTLSDLVRAREAGLFEGDPGGVFLERPMYGEAPPGWEDFLSWIANFATVIAAVGAFVALMRRRLQHWKERGASTPYAFLDVVVGREEWDRDQLCQLLRLDSNEATDLLTTLGFVSDSDDPTKWRAQPDPGGSTLRGKILHEWLHHPVEGEDSDED